MSDRLSLLRTQNRGQRINATAKQQQDKARRQEEVGVYRGFIDGWHVVELPDGSVKRTTQDRFLTNAAVGIGEAIAVTTPLDGLPFFSASPRG